MWYMLAPASRISRSITSAIVVCSQHLARGLGGVRERALGVAPERTVEQLHDLQHRDRGGVAGEAVAALDAALGADHPRAPEHREQLLEELHGHLAPARELADRHRPGPALRPSSASACTA